MRARSSLASSAVTPGAALRPNDCAQFGAVPVPAGSVARDLASAFVAHDHSVLVGGRGLRAENAYESRDSRARAARRGRRAWP